MIEIKEKACKGTGKAKGYGCGKKTKHRVYGLGKMCGCYSDWLLTSEVGKAMLNAAMSKVTKPRIDLEKAQEQKKNRQKISFLLVNVRNTVHKYIKMRDYGKPCISCGSLWKDDFQAGHMYKAELYSTLKFNEYNISGQCCGCNLHKEGNESGYRVGFINRYGAEKLKEIDDMAQKEKQKTHKWERQDLEDIRSVFQEKLKLLTNTNNSNE